jgi:hypothetical protein
MLTLERIARDRGLTVAAVERQIDDARWELFHGLSEAGSATDSDTASAPP